jgi:hypothetical protein
MIALFNDWKDRMLGRGEAAITVPVFDGALKSNRYIEDARILATLDDPEDLATDGNAVFIADGSRVLQIMPDEQLEEILHCKGAVTALACLPEGGLAVAIDGAEVRIEGGPHHGRSWTAAGGRAFSAVNAISVATGGRLLVTDGSSNLPYAEWKRDLMSLGRSGRIFELQLADGGARVLASGMAYAFGVAEVNGGIWASESWKHHVVNPGSGPTLKAVTDGLPGYPSRLVPATSGGAWLTCFALRTQLVEFVLREHTYRKRMMAEMEPAHWIAPALNSGNTFLEPMQGAQLKMMGVVKPWAPPRSYGLVVRLDDQGLVRYSVHSRFDGKNHGVLAAAECGGQLYMIAKGCRRLLALDIAAVEKELIG